MKHKPGKKEITGHLMGGMGNLLFIVATCYALSKKNNSSLIFYTKPWNDKRKNIIKYNMFKNFKLDLNIIRNYNITYNEKKFFYDDIHIDSCINNCIYGYFQSYKYFESCKTEFVKMLHNPYSQIVESTIHQYKQPVETENNNTLVPISIHVRRTDYLSLSHIHLNLSSEYYSNAISHFSTENSIFIIFSDDVTFIQNEPLFQNLPHKVIVDNPDDEYCFWLMSACTHNIIANSSYSWWASYINSNPDKLVVAPNRWFGPSGPQHKIRDIIPDTHNYKLVDVDCI
jgi:hypothetical protein